jgi:hypothetical protein
VRFLVLNAVPERFAEVEHLNVEMILVSQTGTTMLVRSDHADVVCDPLSAFFGVTPG